MGRFVDELGRDRRNFEAILEKLDGKLHDWKSDILLQMGRLTLIQPLILFQINKSKAWECTSIYQNFIGKSHESHLSPHGILENKIVDLKMRGFRNRKYISLKPNAFEKTSSKNPIEEKILI